MKRILIVGGANGIGLSLATELAKRPEVEKIHIVDRASVAAENLNSKFVCYRFDLESDDYSFLNQFKDIDSLMITAGFGRLRLFKDIDESYITSSFKVNAVAPIRIIKHFYDKILSNDDFYCGVMVSIAGFMSSPFFSIYAATKAALKIFIESVNVELEKSCTTNRILNVSPGSIKGTSFNQGKTDLLLTRQLAQEIIGHLEAKDDLFIPQYEEVFKDVLARYAADFRDEGRHSYEYKIQMNRTPILVIEKYKNVALAEAVILTERRVSA